MDRDGTNDGYDIELTRAVADAVPVPVIASGGAGELAHLSEAIAEGGADAVLCASIFHYGQLPRARGEAAPRRRRHPGPALSSAGWTASPPRCAAPTRSWTPLRAAAAEPVYLVGGAVRDLLLGRGRADIDLVVEGDAAALAARLGAETVAHERFATAKVELDGHEVDIASARTETYPRPGALPEVTAAAAIEADLGRRDFTINAMAIPLTGEPQLIDPHDGRADLEAGLLRVLHRGSFVDDPTRAIRAARYAARFGFELEPGTAELLRATDLGTVSADRREAELLRLAAEATAPRALALLAEWGLLEPREGGVELASRVAELLLASPWRELAPREPRTAGRRARPGGRRGGISRPRRPSRPSEAVELARGHDPVELVLARALGAEWLDDYAGEWRSVELEIDGERPDRGRRAAGPGTRARAAPRRCGASSTARSRVASRSSPSPSRPPADRPERFCHGDPGPATLSCLVRAWSGVSTRGCGGWRRTCVAPRPPSATRLGGVSDAPFDSLNLGVLTDDADDRVRENRRRLAAALGRDPATDRFRPPGPRRRAGLSPRPAALCLCPG